MFERLLSHASRVLTRARLCNSLWVARRAAPLDSNLRDSVVLHPDLSSSPRPDRLTAESLGSTVGRGGWGGAGGANPQEECDCECVCVCMCALCWDNTAFSHTFSTGMAFSFLLLFEHLVLMTPWQSVNPACSKCGTDSISLFLHKLV